jgi:hypothetical protein
LRTGWVYSPAAKKLRPKGPNTAAKNSRTWKVSMNTEEPVEEVTQQARTHHPVRTLLLLDVIQDRQSRPTFIWAATTLLFGTVVYHWLEGWSYLDALYFSIISLATIGYGDLTPTTPEAKIFTILYVINGIVILLAFFDRVRIVRSR